MTDCRDGFHRYPLHLETKYYTADIDVEVFPASWFWNVDHVHEESSDAKDKLLQKLSGAEGIALVLDYNSLHESCKLLDGAYSGGKKSDTDVSVMDSQMRRWNALIQEMENIPSLLLCVGTNFRFGKNDADAVIAEMPATPQWCVNEGWEFVAADLSQPFITNECRDKQGVARIVEAMEAVMWTGLEMRSKPASNPTKPSLASAGGQNSGTEDDQSESTALGDDGNIDVQHFEEEEQMLNKLMSDISSVREMARGIDREDDGQRKANQDRASQVAMRLMELMGVDDDDDEDQGNEDL